MASNVEDLTIHYEEDGVVIIKELDKEILSKGAWATVLFRYQEFNRGAGEYGPDKYSIRRYRKMDGDYRPQTKFNISSPKQGRHIVDTLTRWLAEVE